ncbi:MAG: hypothetical protein N4A45_10520 [Flavobacteriales bacterium]|jgi:ribonucleotide reductase alpha subunit|nr:hypothetical protein [Flavobacteriales bacterium]
MKKLLTLLLLPILFISCSKEIGEGELKFYAKGWGDITMTFIDDKGFYKTKTVVLEKTKNEETKEYEFDDVVTKFTVKEEGQYTFNIRGNSAKTATGHPIIINGDTLFYPVAINEMRIEFNGEVLVTKKDIDLTGKSVQISADITE